MYKCDPEAGCICIDEELCKGGQQVVSLSPLSEPSKESSTNSASVIVIVVVLAVALLVTVLGVWYYKRRTRVLEKDLHYRSVYYVEGSILDPARHHQLDSMDAYPETIVIRDEHQSSPLVSRSQRSDLLGAAGFSSATNLPNNLVSRYLILLL